MKAQQKFQSIVCIAALASAALCFIFALGLATDVYQLMQASDFGFLVGKNAECIQNAQVYYDIQDFNSMLVKMTLVMIVTSVLLFITKTNSRRKYYISNYVVTALVAVSFIAISIWAIAEINVYKADFYDTDFETFKAISEQINIIRYTENPTFMNFSLVTFCIAIGVSLIVVGNLIWKIIVMKHENELLMKSVTESSFTMNA